MTNLPPVTIALTTYYSPKGGMERWEAVQRTLRSWGKHLLYAGEYRVHISDDGSEGDYLERTIELVTGIWGEPNVSVQSREGYGASLNQCFRHTEGIAFHGVDDWMLMAPFELTPWVSLLQRSDYSIGMVRLGPPHPWLAGDVVMFEEGWFLHLARHHFVCGLRPALWTRAFWQQYGPFQENTNALEAERLFNERFCQGGSLGAALALPDPWEHQYTESLSAAEPS